MANVRGSRSGREKSSEVLAYEAGISHASALRILRRNNIHNVKPTTKCGLTDEMRAARLKFCLDHQDWDLERWKDVIFSDETAVVLGHRRGAVRLWRAPDEGLEKTVIRERWKGYTEFMFWGCFSYDRKGPCHIWKQQTVAQKKKDDLDLAEVNTLLEPIAKAEWELSTGVRRINLRRNPGGKKPQWRWNEANGKLIRKGKGGVDFWRHYKEIMIPKFIPFAKECQKSRPSTLIQEDGAPAHKHHHQATVYALHDVVRLTWPGNSPDLNATEPGWWWMKRRTTARGAPKTRKEMEQAWLKAWNEELSQEQIQRWIERIPIHIQEIIALEGGNEYEEGRKYFKRSFAGLRVKGKLSKHTYLS